MIEVHTDLFRWPPGYPYMTPSKPHNWKIVVVVNLKMSFQTCTFLGDSVQKKISERLLGVGDEEPAAVGVGSAVSPCTA